MPISLNHPIGRGFFYLALSRGDHGLGGADQGRRTEPGFVVGGGEPRGLVVTAVEHDGRRVLCRGAQRGASARRQARIFNTGQGNRFMGSDFAGILATAGIEISMDGRGRFMATVFARRFLTHEAISIEGDADGRAAQDSIFLGLEFWQLCS